MCMWAALIAISSSSHSAADDAHRARVTLVASRLDTVRGPFWHSLSGCVGSAHHHLNIISFADGAYGALV